MPSPLHRELINPGVWKPCACLIIIYRKFLSLNKVLELLYVKAGFLQSIGAQRIRFDHA